MSDDPTFVAARTEDDSPVGNVLIDKAGRSRPIDRAGAYRRPVGRRGQRAGLCYDPEEPGLDLNDKELWPHVIEPSFDSTRLQLGVLPEKEGKEPHYTVLDVGLDEDIPLVEEARLVCSVHDTCREQDPGHGFMVGAGDHARRDGLVQPFVLVNGGERRDVSSALERAGRVFAARFTGRGLGFEAMLKVQEETWPVGARASRGIPVCWDASSDYGGSSHVDRDGAESFACWLQLKRGAPSRNWALLFPRHGVVVRLRHGTWVRWDGRFAPHCTAIPQVAEGDNLLSLFCSLPADVLVTFERLWRLYDRLRERSAPASTALVPGSAKRVKVGGGNRSMFEEGNPVECLVTVGVMPEEIRRGSRAGRRRWAEANARRMAGVVVKVDTSGIVVQTGPGTTWEFSHSEAQNRVTCV